MMTARSMHSQPCMIQLLSVNDWQILSTIDTSYMKDEAIEH